MDRTAAGLVLTLAFAHCVGGCSSEDTAHGAVITADWSVVRLETNTEIPCPLGFESAVLHNIPLDSDGNAIGDEVADRFDCSVGRGTSSALIPGFYDSWIELTTSDVSNDVFARSLTTRVDVTTEDGNFTTRILEDGGYFRLAWKLVDESTGNDLSCDQAGVTNGIEVIAFETSSPANSASDAFECAAGRGDTEGYLAGSYTVSVAALGADDDPIGSAPDLTNVIESRNAVTDLGIITIPISNL